MRKFMALLMVLCCILGMVGCKKTTYSVTIDDNYPIANTLKSAYTPGEEVTIKLETITEHYYVLQVNGVEQPIDPVTSDLMYTYYTFTMPSEDVVIRIEDRGVDIPPAPTSPQDEAGSIALTIVESVPSGVAFHYLLPNTPYCFYGFDDDENLYRVLWTDWEGLKEKDRVIVKYEKLETLTYDEYPVGGWTPPYELTATEVHTSNCISEDQGVYLLTLPESGKQIKLSYEETLFVPYITDALVAEAEKNLNEQLSQFSNSSGFYLQVDDDYLCLVQEVIEYIPVEETPGEDVLSGCGIDHNHLFFSERISLRPVCT